VSFCTAINCMDGRTQLPVIEFLRRHFGANHVDSVTEPAPVRILADRDDPAAVESICRRVAISLDKHGSRGIGLVAHHDCAGNPADEAAQRDQLARATAFLRARYPQVEVVGLWLGKDWMVQAVAFDASEPEGT